MKESIAEEIVPFQESMNRRFKRDVANLGEYYASLKEEMEKSLERPGLSDQLIKDRQEKIAGSKSIPLSYRFIRNMMINTAFLTEPIAGMHTRRSAQPKYRSTL